MSQQRAMWARRIGVVCGEACERAVAEEVRGMLEDGLSLEQAAREAGRAVERLVLRVLGELHGMTAAANDDVEDEAA